MTTGHPVRPGPDRASTRLPVKPAMPAQHDGNDATTKSSSLEVSPRRSFSELSVYVFILNLGEQNQTEPVFVIPEGGIEAVPIGYPAARSIVEPTIPTKDAGRTTERTRRIDLGE